jgi:hypothetical protein
MGKPNTRHGVLPRSEYIGPEEGTGGIETSQYPEERKATATPLVAASEKGRDQTVSVSSLVALLTRCCGIMRHSTRCVTKLTSCCVGERLWKGRPQWVIAPYPKRTQPSHAIPSNAETEKIGVNLWGPPHKSKYSLATDSELVP